MRLMNVSWYFSMVISSIDTGTLIFAYVVLRSQQSQCYYFESALSIFLITFLSSLQLVESLQNQNTYSVQKPLWQSQMIMPFSSLEIPHLQLMFDPVKVLSPVIITHPIQAFLSTDMAPLVSGLSLFSKIQKPLNDNSCSASLRVIPFASTSLTSRLAIASTLNPQEAYFFRTESQSFGMVSFLKIVNRIQGEPFVLLWQTTLILCRSESNSNLLTMMPSWPRSLSKAKITSGFGWDWFSEKLPKLKVFTSMGSPTSQPVAQTLTMVLLAAMLVSASLMYGQSFGSFKIWLIVCQLLMMGVTNFSPLKGTRVWKSMPSQVSVPVLSKQQKSVIPPSITLFCSMQKIFFRSSLSMAQMMPKVMLTGRAGVTAMVTRLKKAQMRSEGTAYLQTMRVMTKYVITIMNSTTKMNLQAWTWKMFSCYFGKRMIRMSCPFIVTKFVRITQTGSPYSSLNSQNFEIFFLLLAQIMVVPSQRQEFLSMAREVFANFSKESAFLTIGADSPVSAHSLINALPSKMIPSKGILIASFRKTISPGTISSDEILSTFPFLSTWIWTQQQAILNIFQNCCLIWQRLMVIPMVEKKKMMAEKQKYFRQTQYATLEKMKTQSGRRIYWIVSTIRLGLCRIIVPDPQVFFSTWACASLKPYYRCFPRPILARRSRQSYILTLTISLSTTQVIYRLTKHVCTRLLSSSIMNTRFCLATIVIWPSQLSTWKWVAQSRLQKAQQKQRSQ